MDNKLNMVMNYFIEYETHNRLNDVNLKNYDGTTVTLDKLNDGGYITKYLFNKKKEYIRKEIKQFIQDYDRLDTISGEILNLEKKTKENLKLRITEILKNYHKEDDKSINIKINKIVDIVFDDVVTVLYPIYQAGGKRFALIASYCKIADDQLCVEKYKVSEDLLDKLLVSKGLGDLDEHLGGKNKKEEFFQALNSMNNSCLNELRDLVLAELKNKIPVLSDELQNGKWKQAIITVDELKEVKFSPFKEEIVLLKSVYNDAQNSLVKKYIFPENNRKHINQLSFESHFGSYTSDYSVNEKQWKVVNAVRKNQLISVTGPPGTGKTTVIKEIIADSFVEKTKKIIELWNSEWKELNGNNNLKVFQSPLEGSNFKSILVTSTNNEAVDNIGQEISREIQYLPDKNEEKDVSSFCAKLGKKENIESFVENVLKKKIDMLREYQDTENDDYLILIEEFNRIYEEISSFNKLSKIYLDYKRQLIVKYNLSVEDMAYDFILKNIEELEEHIGKLKNEINILKNEIILYDNSIEGLFKSNLEDSDKLGKAKLDEVGVITKLGRYNKISKYKVFGKLIAKIIFGDVRLINIGLDSLKSKIADLSSIIDSRKKRINELKASQEEKRIEIKSKDDKIEQIGVKVEDYKTYLSKYDSFKQELNNLNIEISPDGSEFDIYNSKVILTKRNFLFKISLRINENYIFKNKDKVLKNLEYVYQDGKWFKKLYSSDYRYSYGKERNIRLIWETFCLCFPVITTTLHSLEKNKFHMIKGLFDTLLVDEAGQVMPYYLLAPLYRVKRAVIVGDALQLQPIRKSKVNVFNKYEEKIPHYLDADTSSAQNYSDMSSDVYELLKEKDSGIILKEHRRCERSIASFSREHVYDKEMEITKDDEEKEFLKNNVCFIDVRGEKSRYNTNESEVRICKAIVEELLHEYKVEDIGVITPYRNQKIKIREELNKNISVGTVHAFQGKDKEVIIMSMVISSVGDKAGIEFIGGEPNFLNVAFTRAKKQLLIVGNYELIDTVKGNYLEKMNSFIKEHGRVYSIYNDELLGDIDSKYLTQFYKIISYENKEKTSKYDELFGSYIDAGGLIIDNNHYKLLLNLFKYAEKRIDIISPWISSTIVDSDFFNDIKDFIANNKVYRIIFGYNKTKYTLNTDEEIEKIIDKDSNWKNNLADDIQVVKDLKVILKDDLSYKPPLHTKAIIIDEEYLIIGSHNWLIKKGQRSNARQEVSCIIRDEGMIKFLMDKWK